MGRIPARIKVIPFRMASPLAVTPRSSSILSRAGASIPESTLRKKIDERKMISKSFRKLRDMSVRSRASDKSIDVCVLTPLLSRSTSDLE